MEVETPALSETTLLVNVETAFALEPVAITRRHNQTTLKLCSFNSQMSCCCRSWHQPPETTTDIILNITLQREPNQQLFRVTQMADS